MKIIYTIFCIIGLVFSEEIDPNRFPDDFIFGFATASYQIEGAWNEDGKGENVWDRFVHTEWERIADKSTGDVACDSYHKYEEDVEMLRDVGANMYRFSLSWSRILPTGDISYINEKGVTYYNNLINKLLANDIEPMVTIFHWDLPQPLQDLGGWPNPIMVDYYADYARLVFELFGDRVKWWITFNEPFETCMRAYGVDISAPAVNMSGIADYLCGHTILKSHALVYHIYNDEFKEVQKGQVGITLSGGWNEGLTNSEEDKECAERTLQFEIGWFLHPLLGPGGDYPQVMRERIDSNSKKENRTRSRLPYFTEEWKNYIQGTIDYLGVNHYTTYLISPETVPQKVPSFSNDINGAYTQNSSWPGSSAFWLKVEPTGFRKKLNWLKNYTNNFPIIITENGYADYGELDDFNRINYHKEYLKQLLKAIYEDNCNVKGYIAWSLMDNFEWIQGYSAKFGVYQVNFEDSNRIRTPKLSASFFKELIATKIVPDQIIQF